MKNIQSVLLSAVLCVGMIYALLSIAAVPAYACTPTDCATLSQEASTLCNQVYCTGHGAGGQLVSCNSSGFEIDCYSCGFFGGTCTN